MTSVFLSDRPRLHVSAARGFTLIEVMMVVILVGVITSIALPQMGEARRDRTVYEDAAAVATILRDARARAIGRGAAVVVSLSTASSSRGTYTTYEAVTPQAAAPTVMTVTSNCKRGNLDFTDANANRLVESLTLDSGREVQANIRSNVLNAAGALITQDQAYICFTPTGRAYYSEGTTANFDAALPMAFALTIIVRRVNPSGVATAPDLGLRRRVVIPPTGIARVIAGPPLSTDPV